MKKIFWISSYPKSGNTWMRAILSSLFFSKNGNFDFILLEKIDYFDRISKYEFVKRINLHDYNNLHKISSISKYWIKAQENANVGGDFAFFKTHNANLVINNNKYTNEKNTRGFIYLVRDPRDVAVSWAKHQGFDFDLTIDFMTNEQSLSRTTHSSKGIPMKLLRWDQHYKSWKNLDAPCMFIKYEDLLKNTENIIQNIFDFFEHNFSFKINNLKNTLENIISSTNFNILQKKEVTSGFKEANKSRFFRKGSINQWESSLSNSQIDRLNKEFKNTMIELGYLNNRGI